MPRVSANIEKTINRGQESWTFIYVTLGFALTILGSYVSMWGLTFPWNYIVYPGVVVVAVWLWLFNAQFQNWIIGMKSRYENRPRRL